MGRPWIGKGVARVVRMIADMSRVGWRRVMAARIFTTGDVSVKTRDAELVRLGMLD